MKICLTLDGVDFRPIFQIMKRMYVVLSVIILVSAWMLQALGQKLSGRESVPSHEEQYKRRLQLREEMHKRMMDKLLFDRGSDDLFSDMESMMDQAMSESFLGVDAIGARSSSLKMDWSESKAGRTLIIAPEDPAQKIDLDVKGQMITVKGERKAETENGTSMSHFSNSFPVPEDCDGSKVKIKNVDGKIVLEFPYRKQASGNSSRVPIEPQGDEVSI